MTDIDILAIVLLESFGIVSFSLALAFFKQSQKISDKQESLKKATTDENRNWPSYSYKWVMGYTFAHTRRKLLAATPFAMACLGLMGVLIFFLPAPLLSTGYLGLVAITGIATLLKTDVFEAYSYSKAVQKVPLDHLSREDQSYMELAKEALEKAIIRFLIIGIIFAIAGPFIPQIFDGLVYALVTYTRTIFQATHVPIQGSTLNVISLILAFAVAFILTGILLYLPELTGRIIFRRAKLLAQRTWERWRKR